MEAQGEVQGHRFYARGRWDTVEMRVYLEHGDKMRVHEGLAAGSRVREDKGGEVWHYYQAVGQGTDAGWMGQEDMEAFIRWAAVKFTYDLDETEMAAPPLRADPSLPGRERAHRPAADGLRVRPQPRVAPVITATERKPRPGDGSRLPSISREGTPLCPTEPGRPYASNV